MKEEDVFGQLSLFFSAFQQVDVELGPLVHGLAQTHRARQCPIGMTLIVAGAVPSVCGWVLKGIAMEYELNENGHKTVMRFIQNGMVIIPDGFLQQKPSRTYIEMVSACWLLVIGYPDYRLTLQHYPVGHKLLPWIIGDYLQKGKERERLLCLTPLVKRVAHFRDTKPGLFYHVPAQYLASYLNTSPSSFSRARALLIR